MAKKTTTNAEPVKKRTRKLQDKEIVIIDDTPEVETAAIIE